MIEIKHLTKIFNRNKKNELTAVDDVTLSIDNGEIFGILGPNGAGKTTTLRIIATILLPTSGTVTVDGYSVVDDPERVRKNIGFLTGETKLYDRLTILETLDYFGRLYNVTHTELQKRVNDLITSFDLIPMKNKRIADLSDGMKQKVSLGRTIIHNPDNLILDEPLTGLDILARRAMANFIKDAKKHNNAIIFSTHVMSEAEELCDRIAIIHKGKILSIGKKEALKKEYNCSTLEEIFVKLTGNHNE